jgi:hypothetical protein
MVEIGDLSSWEKLFLLKQKGNFATVPRFFKFEWKEPTLTNRGWGTRLHRRGEGTVPSVPKFPPTGQFMVGKADVPVPESSCIQ